MGTARPFLDLVYRVGSWISGALLNPWMSPDQPGCGCGGGSAAHRCRSCSRFFCPDCMQTPVQPKLCKFCYGAITGHLEGDSKLASQTLRCSTHRNCEEDDSEDGAVTYSTPLSVFSQDSCNSDTDGNGHEFFSAKSSPMDSPSQARDSRESSSYLRRRRMEEEMLESVSEFGYGNLAVCNEDGGQKAQPRLDFENNSQIWYPPPALVVEDDVEMLFRDDEEDGYASDSGTALPSARFSGEGLLVKEKPNHANKERLRSTLREHFTALVAQLLEEEDLQFESEDGGVGWLEIVSSLAWQAANFVKPDTSKGDSMDPGSYVKVKCISSGSPSDSILVKGIVCTKNIKHKHMVSQHKNPRLLILGGALGVPNRLASMKTVHEQETDYLNMAVSKIEAHRPNVLLVEKTVSSYVQEYLLTREISLVLNVKRALLERISRCTGAQIASSVDNLASVRTGQCEMFRIGKEECLSSSTPSKKFVKTLMFFEGCPRRLGCTVLLKGACLEELKKVKGVIQFASFAAYHLSLESSYLADEGASLPKFPFISPSMSSLLNLPQDDSDEHKKVMPLGIKCSSSCSNISSVNENIMRINNEQEESEDTISSDVSLLSLPDSRNGDYIVRSTQNLSSGCSRRSTLKFQCREPEASSQYRTGAKIYEGKMLKRSLADPCDLGATGESNVNDTTDMNCHPSPYFSAAESRESILVSLSSSCISKGIVCERSRLFRIKFYSTSDKPLGQYLRDDLFSQTSSCRSCQEPAEAHVRCYMHQQGSLTISVKRLPSVKLSGEPDDRIWMWHRCLKCERKDGVPPAAHRVVMSDPAWGLSFGKFLELSFSNHRTANRVADCGHSLQRDCLRFYGLGSMVAFFRYSPVDILSVNLPPLVLDFSCDVQPEWMRREAALIPSKLEYLHGAVGSVLCNIEQRMTTSDNDRLNASIQEHISDLRDLLKRERYEYDVLLHSVSANNSRSLQPCLDTLELNRLGRSLLIDSYTWDRRLHLLDSISKVENSSSTMDPQLLDSFTHSKLEGLRNETFRSYGSVEKLPEEVEMKLSTLSRISRNSTLSKHHADVSFQVLECNSNNLVEMDMSIESVDGYIGPAGLNLVSGQSFKWDAKQIDAEDHNDTLLDEGVRSPENNLSDKIDLLWTGSGPILSSSTSMSEADSVGSLMDNPRYRKLRSPARVYSFDSALRYQNKITGPSALKSFDTLGNLGNFVKDPLQNMRQAYTQRSLRATRSLNIGNNEMPSASPMVIEGARFLLSRPGLGNIVILVYDEDPTSIISYAISSQEHTNFIVGKLEGLRVNETNRVGNYFDRPHEYNSHFHDDLRSQFYGSNDPQQLRGRIYPDPKEPHFRFSFEDDSSIPSDKVKFSVTCYFARQFDALRRKCCPNEVDFIRSLSRCKPWKAQGGKSNVYFAKSWDERFIIKQVTKTELDSFEEFAPEYFKYLTESINNGSPTCLAKVLGIYQVNAKHLKGGREMKLDLIVMENLFFQRNISRVYDLKGSARSRYNPDTSVNKVLLDLNLLETLRTKPIFLGSKSKRTLERAVWNDTSFLASIDVMDYSLLVGVDEEKNELVIGIIDFMRQYTWDKHLETWVKASGILGGPKNVSPTVVSPKEYKKRFRKAMSSYFLTFPDRWSS